MTCPNQTVLLHLHLAIASPRAATADASEIIMHLGGNSPSWSANERDGRHEGHEFKGPIPTSGNKNIKMPFVEGPTLPMTKTFNQCFKVDTIRLCVHEEYAVSGVTRGVFSSLRRVTR
ncbi:hypothetical protein F4823DRAFT_195424 [Ustulina deusta]|nr:hypothetical protein F4823DRAFT_195424 [Ustulina deusta]